MNAAPRYAIYLTPDPDEPLWGFGSNWLGYDAVTRKECPHPTIDDIPNELIHEVTAHPRLYGLHMTLKAPFRLADGASVQDLEAWAEDLAKRHDPLDPLMLTLEARVAGNRQIFLCLAPQARSAALHRLEADAVVALDPLRSPLTPAEIARRKPERLSRTQRDFLGRYGYPYVLDAYQPHVSLTGPIPNEAPLYARLAEKLSAEPDLMVMTCRSLCVFEQPEPGARFHIRQRFSLG